MKNALALVAALGIAVCIGSPSWAADPIRGNFVAKIAEPAFRTLSYAQLPPAITMIVRSSTQDIVAYLQLRFPKLRAERSHLTLQSEELVVSQGKFYRRMRMYNEDLEARGPHGACGQWIAVWFDPSGKESGVYVDEPACAV